VAGGVRKYKGDSRIAEINPGMDLDGFKRIFWWECHHWLWAADRRRLLLLFLWFAVREGFARPLCGAGGAFLLGDPGRAG
jgi:heme A synthase